MENEEQEESIEELFNQFIEAVKNLPEKDLDTIYNNLQEMEQKESQE